jgi:hypothetical protein
LGQPKHHAKQAQKHLEKHLLDGVTIKSEQKSAQNRIGMVSFGLAINILLSPC